MAYCYQFGEGVEPNYDTAVEWYKKAMEQDFNVAKKNIGDCYYYENGFPQDYKKAYNWYQKAAAQKNEDVKNMAEYIETVYKKYL